MENEKSNEWHWFKGGLLVSLLSVATYFIFAAIADRNYPFGVTAGFGFIAAKFGSLFSGLNENPVIKRFGEKPDAFIEFFLIIGLIIGGYTASKLSGNFKSETIPAEWVKYHGKSIVKRYVFVFVGSLLLGYGAALSSGCTTGNILQGWAHLSLGSMVAGASFFVAGIITAKILYPKVGGSDGTN
ncbi:MAG: YeeE/YedE thiosulfate transporter family protein [Ignavibacteria bacterium]|nr:YeeE/YedE thiosulfate transporter family protein [Ignavibacteria bacterium]MDP3832053.1 YeeE/YedE thiosulfate transporter family protein [Ignavibacteriaceae bacterium]